MGQTKRTRYTDQTSSPPETNDLPAPRTNDTAIGFICRLDVSRIEPLPRPRYRNDDFWAATRSMYIHLYRYPGQKGGRRAEKEQRPSALGQLLPNWPSRRASSREYYLPCSSFRANYPLSSIARLSRPLFFFPESDSSGQSFGLFAPREPRVHLQRNEAGWLALLNQSKRHKIFSADRFLSRGAARALTGRRERARSRRPREKELLM